MRTIGIALGLWLSLSPFAARADQLLLQFNYDLSANTDYDTGLYQVYNAPVSTRQIAIRQSGDYCDLRIQRVQYNTTHNGPLRDAPATGSGATYSVPDGVVNAVQVDFYQNYWTGVTCELSVYATGGGSGPSGDEALLGAVAYGGGFASRLTLRVYSSFTLGTLRFAIPSFCQGVSILEAGTVSGGTYYPATATGDGSTFQVDAVGSTGVSAIQASINGPIGTACDIPVYAAPSVSR
jgi:hypothetical protein